MRMALARGCRAHRRSGRRSTKRLARECRARCLRADWRVRRVRWASSGSRAPPRGNAPEDEDAFLEALSGLAASGIANAHAHREVQRLNTRLDQKIHELAHAAGAGARVVARGGARRSRAPAWADPLRAVGGQPLRRARAGTRDSAVVARQKGATLCWQPAWLDELDPLGRGRAGRRTHRGPAVLGTPRAAACELVFPLRSAAGTFGFAAVGARPGSAALHRGTTASSARAWSRRPSWRSRTRGTSARWSSASSSSASSPLAASIQKNLFPAELPHLPGYALAAMSRPARLVGGDYYDALVVDVARRRGPRVVLRGGRVGEGHRRVAADEQHPGDAARAAGPRGVAAGTRPLHQRPALHRARPRTSTRPPCC